MLKCIAARMVPIPEFIDIWFLDREAEPTDRTAVETVIDTVSTCTQLHPVAPSCAHPTLSLGSLALSFRRRALRILA